VAEAKTSATARQLARVHSPFASSATIARVLLDDSYQPRRKRANVVFGLHHPFRTAHGLSLAKVTGAVDPDARRMLSAEGLRRAEHASRIAPRLAQT
jgi:hypothetical protein